MKINLRTVLFLASVPLIVSNPCALAHTDVTAEQARDLIDSTNDLIVVDVREPSEYCDAIGHIPGALNYPLTSGVLQARYEELPMHGPVLVVCRSGVRSDRAASFLDSKGFSMVYDMLGGMMAWIWETAPCVDSDTKYGGGTGEPNDPYLVYTAEQMNNIGVEPNDWDKNFKLMADIDLAGLTGTDFNIIGTSYNNSFKSFTGVFDGNSHTISNFIYTSTETNWIGLFGRIDNANAQIKDLGLIDPNLDAGTGDYVGSLVGELQDGTITACYVEGGKVAGDENVGGLVGAYGEEVEPWDTPPFTISNCCSTSSVEGTRRVGGLVGSNYNGRITNCYATGSVSGKGIVGGLVGQNGSMSVFFNIPPIPGTIINCYSTGLVSGQSNVGGLVGLYIEGPVIGCLWDIEASGQVTSAGGTGKTTDEMQTASTFLNAGWDFVDEIENGTEDIWRILEGQDYPRLWWELFWAVSPYPQKGSIDVTQPLILQWAPGASVIYHDVYFGEDEDTVKNATTDSPEYKGRIDIGSESYDPGKLALDTTYYWRIDEVNNLNPDSPWKGNVWSFTTADFLIVDDFESYNDNSVVYSEATLTLTYPRDWTIEGVGVLSLWFGDVWSSHISDNAPELMSVALANSDGAPAMVFHENPDATTIKTWTDWNIYLQEFADQGVDLTNVDTISIGFGDKNNPQAGGLGVMYFDDIRLYRPEPEQEPKIYGGFSLVLRSALLRRVGLSRTVVGEG